MILKNLSFVETIQAEEVERERPGPGTSTFGSRNQGQEQHPRELLRGNRNIRSRDDLVPREQRLPKRSLTREQRYGIVAGVGHGVDEKNRFLSSV